MWGREKVNGEMGHEEGVGWIRGSRCGDWKGGW